MQQKMVDALNGGDLEINDIYSALIEMMGKYKTLAHQEIHWCEVFSFSYKILNNNCCDVKVLFYLTLSCINLNKDDSYNILCQTLQNYVVNLNAISKNASFAKDKKFSLECKFINNILHELSEAINSEKLTCSKDIKELLFSVIKELASISGFILPDLLDIKPINRQSIIIENKINKQIGSTSYADISSMNEREYRSYCLNLAEKMLETNIKNITPYIIFLEATWGRINHVPQAQDNISNILVPNENLLALFDSIKIFDKNHIILFINNLALNPFWFEGERIFLNFLQTHGLTSISSCLANILLDILERMPELTQLCFSDNQPFCNKECADAIKSIAYGYFETLYDKPIDTLVIGTETYKVSNAQSNFDKKADDRTLYSLMKTIDFDLYREEITDTESLYRMAEHLYNFGMKSNAALIYKIAIKSNKNI